MSSFGGRASRCSGSDAVQEEINRRMEAARSADALRQRQDSLRYPLEFR
jgi:hypothetical protein